MKLKARILRHALHHLIAGSLLVLISLTGCNRVEQKKDNRIIEPKMVNLNETSHGKLQQLGSGDDAVFLVTLWGTPYEMGKAYGTLLRQQIAEALPNIIKLMAEKSGQPVELLDEVYAQTGPTFPNALLRRCVGWQRVVACPCNRLSGQI
ncbi:MAG: hypothetical protein D6814_03055 [Calditrichaeota bacterium]|nr:MAG: hypothetical protein D6814_03055 [Calditrichota bacterium]